MKVFSKIQAITYLLLLLPALLVQSSPNVAAQQGTQCIIEVSSPSVAYGNDFAITLLKTDVEGNGPINKYEITIIGSNYEGYPERSYTNSNPHNDGRHVFEFKNDHEDDGDNMGKLSHLPPGEGENGEQASRTYTIYGETRHFNNVYETCESTITITSGDGPEYVVYPEIPESERIDEASGFKVDPMIITGDSSTEHENSTINGNTHEVRVTFTGLTPNETYKICLQNDQEDCYKLDKFDLEGDDIKAGSTGRLIIEHLCGAGNKALKQPDDEKPCDPKKDYFHEGHWYTVGLYSKNYRSGPLTQATFYVSYAYPHVFIPKAGEGVPEDGFNAFNVVRNPEQSGIVDIANPFDVKIKQFVKPGKSQRDRNNFQLVLESSTGGYKVEKCVVVEGAVGSYQGVVENFSYKDLLGGSIDGPIPPGEYLLKINEQNEESDWKTPFKDDCQGGFTYYHIPISVQLSEDGQSIKTFIDYSKVQKDPNRVETQEINEQVNHAPLPCAVGIVRTVEGNTEEVPITDDNRAFLQECTKYATAFGPIGLTPLEFINSLGTWLLAIGSVAAIIFMVYSGYIILTSRGDKEKIGNAREILTSAVTGLIFIILSITILEIIGVDILRIPGWER